MMAPVHARLAPAFAGMFAALVIVGVVVAAALRGPWLDEFATLWYSDPNLSLATLLDTRWVAESNLPAFYALVRLWSAVAGDDIFVLRLVNLLPFIFLVGWFPWAWFRRPAHRDFLLAYAVLAFSNRFLTGYFPELRGYCLQYCAEIVFLGAAWIDSADDRRGPSPFQLAAVALLVAVHQVTAIFAVAWVIVLGLADLRRGFTARAAWLGGVTTLFLIPPVGFMVLQHCHAGAVLSQVHWIPATSLPGAITHLLGLFAGGASHNWIGVAAGVALLIGFRLPALPWLAERPSRWELRFCGLLLAGLGLGIAVVLAVNLVTPLLVDRYFSALSAGAICILAILLRRAVAASPSLAALIFANAVLIAGTGIVSAATDTRWNQGARIVDAALAAHPDSLIYVGADPDDATGAALGYGWYAKHRHWTIMPAAARPSDAPLPTDRTVIFWAEHAGPTKGEIAAANGDATAAANAVLHWRLTPEDRARASATVTDDGVVLVIAPGG
jgi:hypothetical protein